MLARGVAVVQRFVRAAATAASKAPAAKAVKATPVVEAVPRPQPSKQVLDCVVSGSLTHADSSKQEETRYCSFE